MTSTVLRGLLPLAALLLCGQAAASDCSSLSPPPVSAASLKRPIKSADLIQLRDIGAFGAGNPDGGILAVSPDGRQLAFQMRQADIASNSYCMGLFVVDVGGNVPARAVDVGGDFIRETYSSLGFAAHTSPGTPLAVAPKWSPDGRWIAFLRRDRGTTQAWRARGDGADAMPVTRGQVDIEDFAWAPDGHSLVYASRPGLLAAEAALVNEGRVGWLYDDRFEPISGNQPMPREPIATVYNRIEIDSGAISDLTEAEAQTVLSPEASFRPSDAVAFARDLRGDMAWTVSKDKANIMAPTALHVRRKGGRETVCASSACEGIVNLWWADDGKSLVFLRREGWRNSLTGLYRWSDGKAVPLRVTSDVLLGCRRFEEELFCGHESSLTPRRLIAINLTTGALRTVFDPNPDFQQVKLGPVERLNWTNAMGVKTFGDLVLPPDHQTGQRHPLVVVLYETRGFLRGGTGDDYPIQLFAANGFAVLSVQNPMSIGALKGAATQDEINRLNRIDWADRRSIQSAIEVGVQLAIDKGVADPKRLGITGLSDGASSVQFALLNSHLFSAAAMSSCCDDAPPPAWLDGPAAGRWLQSAGYPSVTQPNPAFWADVSVRMNAARLATPLLIQTPDREYLGALEGVTALKEMNQPVELYVFPDENHVKWQPVHRAAVYARDIDWFRYWLKGEIDPDPAKAAQYTRWAALKSAKASAPPGY
jgi:dipeptidyl aminopeptidase/acylaminoacyl peptidase